MPAGTWGQRLHGVGHQLPQQVACQGGELFFVEVKTRRGVAFGTPEESVTATESQRLIATPQYYLPKNNLEKSPWHANLISIQLDESGKPLGVNHLENVVGRVGVGPAGVPGS